jgi:hypothetical protein
MTDAEFPMRRIPILVCALLCAALTAAFARVPQPEGIDVGDVASHSFSAPPWNARGTKSLEDLRGRPVLVEFWGTR